MLQMEDLLIDNHMVGVYSVSVLLSLGTSTILRMKQSCCQVIWC
jgi:hypothetical protein